MVTKISMVGQTEGQDLLIAERSEEILGAIEMFYFLIMVTITWMHTFKENASNIIFQMVHFIVGNSINIIFLKISLRFSPASPLHLYLSAQRQFYPRQVYHYFSPLLLQKPSWYSPCLSIFNLPQFINIPVSAFKL